MRTTDALTPRGHGGSRVRGRAQGPAALGLGYGAHRLRAARRDDAQRVARLLAAGGVADLQRRAAHTTRLRTPS